MTELTTLLEDCRRWLAENYDPTEMDPDDALTLLLDAVLPNDHDALLTVASQIGALANQLDFHAARAVNTIYLDHDPANPGFTFTEYRRLVIAYLMAVPNEGIWDTMTALDPSAVPDYPQ